MRSIGDACTDDLRACSSARSRRDHSTAHTLAGSGSPGERLAGGGCGVFPGPPRRAIRVRPGGTHPSGSSPATGGRTRGRWWAGTVVVARDRDSHVHAVDHLVEPDQLAPRPRRRTRRCIGGRSPGWHSGRLVDAPLLLFVEDVVVVGSGYRGPPSQRQRGRHLPGPQGRLIRRRCSGQDLARPSFGRLEGRPSWTGAACGRGARPRRARRRRPPAAGCGPGAERNGALVDCRPPDPPAPPGVASAEARVPARPRFRRPLVWSGAVWRTRRPPPACATVPDPATPALARASCAARAPAPRAPALQLDGVSRR